MPFHLTILCSRWRRVQVRVQVHTVTTTASCSSSRAVSEAQTLELTQLWFKQLMRLSCMRKAATTGKRIGFSFLMKREKWLSEVRIYLTLRPQKSLGLKNLAVSLLMSWVCLKAKQSTSRRKIAKKVFKTVFSADTSLWIIMPTACLSPTP